MLKKDITKELTVFERKVLKRISGGNKVNETWRKCYNVELVELFGNFDTLSFIIISWLK
jgi:hypothetical protein